jgi:S-adenosylmethionine decarboxylase
MEDNNILGLHTLLTLQSHSLDLFTDCESFIVFIHDVLETHQLFLIGETHHTFENKSFTIAFCLKESHICIHTWPEINKITADIYLCNYSKNNEHLVKLIAEKITNYFDATIINQSDIYR